MPVTIGGSGPITGVTSINTTVRDAAVAHAKTLGFTDEMIAAMGLGGV